MTNKILIINTLYAPLKVGGAENSVRLMAEDLVKKDFDVTLLTLKDPDSTVRKETINGVKVERIKLLNLYWPFNQVKHNFICKFLWHFIDIFNIPMFFKVYFFIKKLNPSIVHTNNIQGFSVSIWFACKILRKKIIHTTRDYYLLCANTMRYKNSKRCTKSCLSCSFLSYPKKVASKLVDVDVGISEFILKKHLANNYFSNNKKNGVIYNVASNQSEIISDIKVDKINKIGFIGRLHESKGIELFLEFALLNTISYEFFIAGTGDPQYGDYLKEKYKNDKIKFLGHIAPKVFYNQIDLLVVPSDWDEPFGRVVVEAIENNIPVLVTDRGGLSELVYEEYTLGLKNNRLINVERCIYNITNNGYKVKLTKDTLDKYQIYNNGNL